MKQPEAYILNEEHHYFLDRIEHLQGVLFLTGKAGTGKSTLLKLLQKITQKNIVILAPTGIAAVQIKGQTIHSFFRFPAKFLTPDDYKSIPKNIIKKIDLIVIDEISMVRADLLDHIDQVLRMSTRTNAPFGNIPMLWIGDLFQLPPVLTNDEKEFYYKTYPSSYFFASRVFKSLSQFEMIELSQIFRQKDPYFIRILNQIRIGEFETEDIAELNKLLLLSHKHNSQDHLRITVTATNAIANAINAKKLNEINTSPKIYQAKKEGTVLANQYPNEEALVLKPGAQILFIRNDPNKQYVNGTLGIIIECLDHSIKVQLDHINNPIEVPYMNWEIIKYNYDDKEEKLKAEIVGSYTQLPVKLGWAITIHKSQGQTFEYINIDLGYGAFEKGQTYVALSRSKTIEGIQLLKPLKPTDIRFEEEVIDFMRKYN